MLLNEKYTQLLLSHQIRGITTIGDTHKLPASLSAKINETADT